MSRLALTIPMAALFMASLALAPAVASACCGDVDKHEPLGWSLHGALLVRAYASSDCYGTLALETLSPGDVVAEARFDLYRGGRRLAEGEGARELSDDAAWDARDELAEGEEAFPVPRHLRRHFGFPVQTVRASDLLVLGRADPSDALDAGYWDSHVLITVYVRGAEGFVELGHVRIERIYAAHGRVFVHPAPDGRRAILRFSTNGPESAVDDIRWVTFPEGVTVSGLVGAGDGSLVIAARENLGEPEAEENGYHISSLAFAREQLAAATDPALLADLRAAVLGQANYALWADPENDVLRAALVEALEEMGATDVAAEVAEDLPDAPLPTFASIMTEAQADDALSPTTTSICHDDAGCPLPPEILEGPSSKPAHAASCNVTQGASSTLAVVLPLFLLVGGMGVSALRRRRR